MSSAKSPYKEPLLRRSNSTGSEKDEGKPKTLGNPERSITPPDLERRPSTWGTETPGKAKRKLSLTQDASKKGAYEGPDLTEQLKKKGLYEEYVHFREGYMRWRQGEAHGAKGELEHAIQRSEKFEHWYPTVGTFNFRRTISFWGGTLTIEGCLLFLWVAYISEYGRAYTDLMYYMTKWPTLCGGTAFLAGIYLPYYELINLDVDLDAETRNYLLFSMESLRKDGIEIWSPLGASLYLVGALLYTLSQVSDLFTLSEQNVTNLVQWPLTIGGFLFFLAGVCELIINHIFTNWPVTYVWWASVFDFFGGVGFWLSACPSFVSVVNVTSLDDDDLINLIGAVGVVCYFCGAIATLCMWRGEQYGTAIIPALNRVTRASSPNLDFVVKKDEDGICHIVPSQGNVQVHESKLNEVLSPKISGRGMFFLTIYILIGVVQMVVVCSYISQADDVWQGGIKSRKVLSNIISDVCNVIMVHMILMLQSACVSTPKKTEQPYRCLFMGIRILSVILVANSILSLEVIFEADVRVQK